ncbi:MAG: hypothetical protein FVQ77_08510 [Cytophagales bacterium]|nr:hypothetical protein [Cytophagales bacterium]
MNQTLYILTFFALLTSCANNTKQDSVIIGETEYLGFSDLPEPQFVTDPDEKKIVSITDTLYKSDTLKIKFKTPHSRDFAITTPDDKFFFVVYWGNDTTNPSLVDWTEFENLDYLEIITDQTTANPWDAREPKNKLIFNITGQYEILLSENLETDDGTPVEVERVYYYDKKNKNNYTATKNKCH